MANPVRRSATSVSDGDLAMLEHSLELTLPPEYRAFLLSTNGGVPQRTKFAHHNKDGKKRETWVDYFHPTTRDGLIDLDWIDLATANEKRPEGLPQGILFVGDAHFLGNIGKVCLGTQGEHTGKVLFRPEVEGKKSTLYFVAESWNIFLEGMGFEEKRERPWRDPIEAGDVEGLRSWLDNNRRKFEEGALWLDLERAVIAENSYAMCLVLIERGLPASDFFEEAMNAERYDLAREILRKQQVGGEKIQSCLVGNQVFLWYLPPFLEELVAAGADVNAEDDQGETPLHKAVTARSEVGVKFLLEKGADPTSQNDDKRTPRKLAQRLEETKLMEILKEGEAAWAKKPKVAEPEWVEFDFKGVELQHVGPALTLQEIKKFESEIGLEFTPEYRGLLLKANGGVPKPNTIAIDLRMDDEDEDDNEDEDDEDEIDEEASSPDEAEPKIEFMPLRNGQGRKLVSEYDPDHEYESTTVEEAREMYHDGIEIPRGMVPIAGLDYFDESTYLLLVCKGKNRGKLHAIDFNRGSWPLHLTLSDIFDLLVQSKARPQSASEKLADAVSARDVEGIRAAIAEGAVDVWSSRDGRMPLRECVEKGFDEGVLAMAEGGWKLHQLLSEAASFNRQTLFDQLAQRIGKLSKEEANELLAFPMTYANRELMKKIVAKGIKLSKKTSWGWSHLFVAVQSGSVEAVQELLDAGCDLHHQTEDGQGVLHFAAQSSLGDPVAMIRFLVERGAKLNQPTSEGHTPLHLAAMYGNLELAKLFIDLGEDLYAKHELRPAGMSPEQAAKHAKKMSKMLGNFEKMLGDSGLDLDEDDAPPPPDTSEPAGEKAAQMMEALDQAKETLKGRMGGIMSGLAGKLAERAMGSWGTGPSALDAAKKNPQGQAIVAELEKYAASKRKASK